MEPRADRTRIGTSPIGLRPADDRQAVDLGQHQVEDDEPRRVLLDRAERGPAVAGGHDPEALALEVRPDESDDLGVVVDDEDRGGRVVRA